LKILLRFVYKHYRSLIYIYLISHNSIYILYKLRRGVLSLDENNKMFVDDKIAYYINNLQRNFRIKQKFSMEI